jgi:capsid protein
VSGQPLSASPAPLLWGRQLVVSPAMPAAQALVGAYAVGGTLYWRHRLRLMVSNSDLDDFTRNLSTVRVELRAALVVDVPAVFGLVTDLVPPV